jgi:hypothetical protein
MVKKYIEKRVGAKDEKKRIYTQDAVITLIQ